MNKIINSYNDYLQAIPELSVTIMIDSKSPEDVNSMKISTRHDNLDDYKSKRDPLL